MVYIRIYSMNNYSNYQALGEYDGTQVLGLCPECKEEITEDMATNHLGWCEDCYDNYIG